MSVARDVGIVIVAGGSSTRTGSTELKQFRWVAGKPALLHSLQTFMARPDVISVVCVLPRAYAADSDSRRAACQRPMTAPESLPARRPNGRNSDSLR